MAQSFVIYTANGSTTQFDLTFPYIEQSHIKVYIDNVLDSSFTWVNASRIQTSTTASLGAKVKVERNTPVDERLVDFVSGSVLSETDLDKSANQNFFTVQENYDDIADCLKKDNTGVYDAGSVRIINVTNPTGNQDAATKHYLENTWLSSTDKTNLTAVAAVSSEMALLGVSAVITDLGILGTSAIVADLDVVADKVTEIGRLGTVAAVADLAILGTSAIVADMALLATTDCIADMALLATSDVISDMNTLATSDIVSDINLLATSDIVSDLNTLATSDIVSDINILATSDIVSDLNTLATSAIVTDLNLLATSANVTNMATLGASGVVANIATLAGVSANITTVATNIAGVNSFAERYRVGSSDPSSSLDEGDLAYNSTSNNLKYYNGSSWITIVAGSLTDVVQDGSPQLGADLDLNSNDITGTGNIAITGYVNARENWESKDDDFTAAAGKSYFCDTTSNNIDVTLPSGSIGDEIRFLDVSGTFDTNDLTVLYGSSKIQGASANLDVGTERAGFALIYYNSTQGWLLKDK